MMKYVSLIILLCITLAPQAQNDTIFQTVAKRLHEFQLSAPVEKIYVHQDRTQYAAGEIIWFKVYQSSPESYPVHSGIVYVDLIDGLNHVIAETKWKLTDDMASGHIELPDSIGSGFYQLRAYTRWMQNFDQAAYFSRELTISAKYTDPYALTTDFVVNGKTISVSLRFDNPVAIPLKYSLRIGETTTRSYTFEVDTDKEANFDIVLSNQSFNPDSLCFILETPAGNREYPISATPPSLITFFPEGGNLISGIPSKIAFKIIDSNGKGLYGEGIVKDESGDTIREFRTSKDGMGSFYFHPEAGKQYTVQLPELHISSELPACIPKGVVLEAKRWDTTFRVILRHNLPKQQSLYLTIHKEGTTWFNTYINTDEPMIVLDIPKQKLPEGIFCITVYDTSNYVYSERLAFVNYPKSLQLTVNTDKKTYGKRQKVSLQIEAKDKEGKSQSGNFSLAVVKSGLDDMEKRNNFYTDYFLQSELKGRIENPASYFEWKDSSALNNMDLLLLTHGWRRYSWQEQISGEHPKLQFPVEQNLAFSGKIHPWSKNQSADKLELNAIFRHDSLSEAIKTQAGPGGSFMFTNYDFHGTAEVILSAQDQMERMLDISIWEQKKTPSNYYSYLQRIKGNQDSVYVELTGNLPQNPERGIDKVIHKIPEVKVIAKRPKKKDQYQLHDNVFSKRIYEVKRDFTYTAYGEAGEGSLGALGILKYMSVKYRNLTAEEKGYNEPVFILDGVRISKRSLTGISPNFIERVEILSDAAAMLYGGKFGGFYFHSRTNMSYDIPTKSVGYKFIGYNQKKEFYSPDYSKGKSDFIVPDHRNTLYWQPNVRLNEEGKASLSFFVSDDKAEFFIFCEGRSDTNELGVSINEFSIK